MVSVFTPSMQRTAQIAQNKKKNCIEKKKEGTTPEGDAVVVLVPWAKNENVSQDAFAQHSCSFCLDFLVLLCVPRTLLFLFYFSLLTSPKDNKQRKRAFVRQRQRTSGRYLCPLFFIFRFLYRFAIFLFLHSSFLLYYFFAQVVLFFTVDGLQLL